MAVNGRTMMILTLALLVCSVAAQDGARRNKKPKDTNTDVPTVVNDCFEFVKAVNDFKALAIQHADPKNPITATIHLACTGNFTCVDPSRKEGEQDFKAAFSGAGILTVGAPTECNSGDKRPKLGGGIDGFPTELIYVGAQVKKEDLSQAPADSGWASLVLENIVFDCKVEGDSMRSAVYALHASLVTLNNVDMNGCSNAAAYGGGSVYVEDSSLTMNGGVFNGSFAYGDGGAIYVAAMYNTQPLEFQLEMVTFSNNEAMGGAGGVLAIGKSTPDGVKFKFNGCTFTNNKANECAVLMSDRYDMSENNKGKVKQGKSLSVDFDKSCTFDSNTSKKGLQLCGKAVTPFKKTFKKAPKGMTMQAVDKRFADYKIDA